MHHKTLFYSCKRQKGKEAHGLRLLIGERNCVHVIFLYFYQDKFKNIYNFSIYLLE